MSDTHLWFDASVRSADSVSVVTSCGNEFVLTSRISMRYKNDSMIAVNPFAAFESLPHMPCYEDISAGALCFVPADSASS